jgi:hypothetical protein
MKEMKKICFAVFAFVIALAFAGAGEAAAPDAKVKGLWLKAPKFPADAEVAEFSYDEETDIVEYARVLADGSGVKLVLHRQPIAESELQSPADVSGIIENWVLNFEGYDEDKEKEYLEAIEVEENAEELSAHFSYPCAVATYNMGWYETDVYKYVSIFIFTDEYCFRAEASAPLAKYGDYEDKFAEWFAGLELAD